jgi:hypothetical protein
MRYKECERLSLFPSQFKNSDRNDVMNNYFVPQLTKDFRNVINKSPIFIHDEQYKNHYYLACVVMDRLDTCVEYLNKHITYPKNEEDFLSFMMFSCMLVDAVKQILKDLDIEPVCNNSEFFSKVCLGSPLNLSEEECPTDDKFFEYFRSLTFAHPFETSRPKFFQKGEIQYSPWVIVNSTVGALHGIPDAIGVRIYSNKCDDILDLRLSFATLKEYIKSRYECISLATKWAEHAVAKEKVKWRGQKINRIQEPIDILKEIMKILTSRYEKTYDIERAINYLKCINTVEENKKAVNQFRNALIEKIPAVCDAVENLDNTLMAEILDDIIQARPLKMHNGAHYQLEKIFSYLREDNNYSDNYNWGLEQALYFSEAFAKKWVIIKPFEMSCNEIKLLVCVACYLEKLDQESQTYCILKLNKKHRF